MKESTEKRELVGGQIWAKVCDGESKKHADKVTKWCPSKHPQPWVNILSRYARRNYTETLIFISMRSGFEKSQFENKSPSKHSSYYDFWSDFYTLRRYTTRLCKLEDANTIGSLDFRLFIVVLSIHDCGMSCLLFDWGIEHVLIVLRPCSVRET